MNKKGEGGALLSSLSSNTVLAALVPLLLSLSCERKIFPSFECPLCFQRHATRFYNVHGSYGVGRRDETEARRSEVRGEIEKCAGRVERRERSR